MLTPEELKYLPDKVVGVWDDYDTWVLLDMASFVYLAGKCKNAGELNALMNTVGGRAITEASKALAKSDRETKWLMERAFKEYKGSMPEGLSFKETKNIFQVYLNRMQGEMKNVTNTIGVISGGKPISLTQAYYNAMNEAFISVSTGQKTLDDGVKGVVQKLADSGVKSIDYTTYKSYDLPAMVRRNITTSVNQCASECTDAFIEENGVEYVQVSAHADARPSHAVWQGGIYKYKDLDKPYPRGCLRGDPADGLGGVNCRHSFDPYFPGKSAKYTWEKQQNVKIDGQMYTPYEVTQTKRAYERNIRKYKRRVEALDEIGIESDSDKDLLKKWQGGYSTFCKRAGVYRESARTRT